MPCGAPVRSDNMSEEYAQATLESASLRTNPIASQIRFDSQSPPCPHYTVACHVPPEEMETEHTDLVCDDPYSGEDKALEPPAGVRETSVSTPFPAFTLLHLLQRPRHPSAQGNQVRGNASRPSASGTGLPSLKAPINGIHYRNGSREYNDVSEEVQEPLLQVTSEDVRWSTLR